MRRSARRFTGRTQQLRRYDPRIACSSSEIRHLRREGRRVAGIVLAHETYVLTGSRAGVYDELFLAPGLIRFLQEAKGQTKLVGICFRRQVMAQAVGGPVIKSPQCGKLGVVR